MFYCYVIESLQTGQWYVGQTNDLEERLKRHNSGYEKFTKNKGPWKIKSYKIFSSRAEAMREERKLKNLKSRMRIEAFLSKDAGWEFVGADSD